MLETIIAAAALTITTTSQPVTIDASLDEPAWQDATEITEFWETFPRDNVEPPVKTVAYIMYDEKNLYLGFKCWDPDTSKIRSTYGDRDQPLFDDGVGISIDTFSDQLSMYDFVVTPVGVQIDALFTEGQDYDATWDTIWDSAGRIHDWGYVVEMAIPFKSIRFPNTPEQRWRVSIYRLYPREYFYSFQTAKNDRNRNCFVCQYAPLEGIRNVQPGRNIEVIPTLSALRTDTRSSLVGGLDKGDTDIEGSLNVSWGITSNLSLQGTLNPDYSHVESDIIQLDINERFALSYPEKRPFFMDGSQYFLSPIDAIYTRSIFDPKWGVKLVGKEGKNSYGVILAQDESTNLLIPSNQGSYLETWGQESDAGVLRYSRDFGTDSQIGVIGTYRSGASYENTVGGVDGRIRVNENAIFSFQGLTTSTRYPEYQDHPSFNGEKISGHAYHLGYTHQSRTWNYKVTYQELDPELRCDLGFIQRVDIKELYGEVERQWWGNNESFFSQAAVAAWGSKTDDFSGLTTDTSVGLYAYAQIPGQTTVVIGSYQDMIHYAGVDYDTNRSWIKVKSSPSKAFEGEIKVDYGDDVDYSNLRPGTSILIDSKAIFKPNKNIALDTEFTNQRLWIDDGTVFDVKLYVGRLYYYFSPKMYVRGLVQLVDQRQVPERYLYTRVNRNTKQLQTQLLFSYKLTPFTLIYLGYSDNGVQVDSLDSLLKLNRSFFVKLSYGFRP